LGGKPILTPQMTGAFVVMDGTKRSKECAHVCVFQSDKDVFRDGLGMDVVRIKLGAIEKTVHLDRVRAENQMSGDLNTSPSSSISPRSDSFHHFSDETVYLFLLSN